MSERSRSAIALFVAIATPLAAGGLGTIATSQAIPTWYRGLRRPSWTPPGWIFGPVWTTLYTMMGVAAWLVWKAGWEKSSVRRGIGLFVGQLFLNAIWTPLFFGRRAFGAALIDLSLLWGMIVATGIQFYRVSRPAGLLMLPYLLWVSYASSLNAGVWWMNRAPRAEEPAAGEALAREPSTP
jgi:translocator protein